MASLLPFMTDVAVIGAGLSGLSAANQLHLHNLAHPERNPVSYIVLEANDRVGGKTLSVPAFKADNSGSVDNDTVIVDMGAAWINEKLHPHIWDLMQRFELDDVIQNGEGKTILQNPKGTVAVPEGFSVRQTSPQLDLFSIEALDCSIDCIVD